jgi:DNA-binding MarR family transcriptional regulator
LDILTTIFWVSAFVAATFGVGYYVQLRRAKREYEKAKGLVEDIVFSFNRQLRQETRRVETIAYKVEAISSRVDDVVSGVDELRNIVGKVKETLFADSKLREPLLIRFTDFEKKAGEIAASQESLLSKVVALEAQAKQPRTVLDTSLEAVIPIKREKALAQLTDTEVSVLELLVSEGAKTAPEIKERVKLSREHTARLMKKLYEEGYLERETGKIPFRYTVKKEMEKFLKKAESEPT